MERVRRATLRWYGGRQLRKTAIYWMASLGVMILSLVGVILISMDAIAVYVANICAERANRPLWRWEHRR